MGDNAHYERTNAHDKTCIIIAPVEILKKNNAAKYEPKKSHKPNGRQTYSVDDL